MTAAASIAGELKIVPGRECGSCTLCCKVYNIPGIGKVASKWCGQCKPGRGYKIHDNLPDQCAAFNCLWRTDAAMPAQWKSDQAKDSRHHPSAQLEHPGQGRSRPAVCLEPAALSRSPAAMVEEKHASMSSFSSTSLLRLSCPTRMCRSVRSHRSRSSRCGRSPVRTEGSTRSRSRLCGPCQMAKLLKSHPRPVIL